MAITKRDLELLDKRERAKEKVRDETIKAPMRLVRRRQVDKITEELLNPPAPKKPDRKVTPMLTGDANAPPPRRTPAPITKPTAPPEAQPIASNPLKPPTMDDAARDVEAASPRVGYFPEDPRSRGQMDPVQPGMALKQPLKRKKYGQATTALTGEWGLGNLGNVASRALMG